jgi:hypothetical protein
MTASIAGELVTEMFEYDSGRPVTVYIPPDPPRGVVFAGDGQLISQWGGVLEAADVPPAMIVGAHRLDDETLRLQEYSRGFEPERFAAHEQFFVEDVRRWVQSRFGVALPVEAPRCSVCRRAESWRSPWGFDTRTSTVRSSAHRRALATDRLQ